MEHNLDLEHSLRPGLDILANEIIISFKKRSRYKQNPEIYRPGLVVGYPDISLLLYELAKMEAVHAELGRYTYSDQEAFTDVSGIPLIIKRESPPSPIVNIPTGKAEAVIGFYTGWIQTYCAPGTDSDTFGESVTSDVANLMNLMERITLGKFVAESKFQKDEARFRKTGGDTDQLRDIITHPEREERVLKMSEKLAEHYEFDAAEAKKIFLWLIKTTVDVQVRYILHRMGQ